MYMPPFDGLGDVDMKERRRDTKALIDTVKPVNWPRMSNYQRRLWHDNRREAIIFDYENMAVQDVAKKWAVGLTTLTYLRKRWGVPKKRGRIKQSAVVV